MLGQRLQSLFLGHGGPGAALGPVREIDVFQHGLGLRGHDLLLQLVGQLPALVQGLEDGLPPPVQLGELVEPVANRGDGHLIEGPGGLLPVPGDERHGGGLIQKGGRRLDLLRPQINSWAIFEMCSSFMISSLHFPSWIPSPGNDNQTLP